MSRIYQPRVIEIANEIIETLKEIEFFEENNITDLTFTKSHLCDRLTEKYIENGLDLEIGIFTEDEFNEIIKTIIIGSVLHNLKESGYVSSYDDENTEELFFLTKEGKMLLEEMKKQNNVD